FEGARVREAQRFADRESARVRVLDDRRRRFLELADEAPRGIDVEPVGERQLRALETARMRYATRWPGHRIERAALMRILPVPQLVQARTAVGELRRYLLLGHATAQEIGDRGVIGGDVCKRLGGETAARRARQGTVPAKLRKHAVILTWRDDDSHRVAVLRGGANHRRSADVDVLDDLGVVCAARQGR